MHNGKSPARHNSALFYDDLRFKKKDHQLFCEDQDVIDAACGSGNVFKMARRLKLDFDICDKPCLWIYMLKQSSIIIRMYLLWCYFSCKTFFFFLQFVNMTSLFWGCQIIITKIFRFNKIWLHELFHYTSEKVATDTQREFLSFIYTFKFPSRQTWKRVICQVQRAHISR